MHAAFAGWWSVRASSSRGLMLIFFLALCGRGHALSGSTRSSFTAAALNGAPAALVRCCSVPPLCSRRRCACCPAVTRSTHPLPPLTFFFFRSRPPRPLYVQEHARSNVKMRRQAHDRWGISKIVFVYCDDFLKRVYTFPWFHEPEWKQVRDPCVSVDGLSLSLSLLPWMKIGAESSASHGDPLNAIPSLQRRLWAFALGVAISTELFISSADSLDTRPPQKVEKQSMPQSLRCTPHVRPLSLSLCRIPRPSSK